MHHILKLLDKTGKTIILTKERWSHIRRDHPEVDIKTIHGL